MAKGKRTGGRAKGTPNKRTQDLLQKTEELGVDPFEILLHFAAGNWEELGYDSPTRQIVAQGGEVIDIDTIPPELRQKAAHDACPYLFPKRKAVDMSFGEDQGSITVTFNEHKPKEK